MYDYYAGASGDETSRNLVSFVPRGSLGWNRYSSTNEIPYLAATNLPTTWGKRSIAYYDLKTTEGSESPTDTQGGGEGGSMGSARAYLTVTNVVVNYVLNSVQPEIAVPTTTSAGLVNIITEVKSGGAVAVPQSWAGNYPGFTEKFGVDFTKALMKETGKRDAAGNPMFVWQDFVVGTDPTDVNDVFAASITMVEGAPVISWTPELPEEQAKLRSYVIYGKVKMQDVDWTVVAKGHEAEYNFFKVVVEMK